jgi:hypothetical protein
MSHEMAHPVVSTLDYASPGTKPARRVPWMMIVVSVFALAGTGAMLLPAMGKSCACVSKRVQCGSNEHQILRFISDYAQNHQGAAPPSLDLLRDDFAASTSAAEVFHCPEGKEDYVYVGFGINVNLNRSQTILLYEPPTNHKDPKTGKGAMNVGYVDGAVRTIVQPQADKIIAELKSGHNPPREEMIK